MGRIDSHFRLVVLSIEVISTNRFSIGPNDTCQKSLLMKRNHVVLVTLGVLVLSGSLLLRARAAAAPDTDSIRMWDNCDPATFNAALAPGACQPGDHGTEKYSIFIGELAADRIAGAWRFGSTAYTIASGDSTALDNRGGELHTFTTVAKLGGGS